jgi:disulfide bond formation protein DsbB
MVRALNAETPMFLTVPTSLFHTRAALFLAMAMACVVGAALAFQYVGGYIPCKLCLEQRWPYYTGAPLMALAALSAANRWPLTRMLLVIGAALMGCGLYLAIYHSGVEWAFWPGPTDCAAVAGGVETDAGNLLNSMNATHPPSCDKAALRILGLSMAGWNAVASVMLMSVAIRAAVRR